MRRIRLLLLSYSVALGSILWTAAPATAAADDEVYYLALGDSLAAGYQPDGTTGKGYPDQLYPQLKARNPDLQFVNLGCSGETTSSMLKNSVCGGSQLDKAVDFIKSHRVAYLTIDIGANDVVTCVKPPTIDDACFDQGLAAVRSNLDTILDELRDAIRRSDNKRFTRSAGMTYYDPTLGAWAFGFPALAVASVGYVTRLNATEAGQYLTHGFRVAPVASVFQTYDFRINSATQRPNNVEFVCGHTWSCSRGDIHANNDGYSVIADTFAGVLRW
jgi:lysophospholipase L1-like esterase